jgi:hypothetical protein
MSDREIVLDQFNYREDGQFVLRPCLQLVFYWQGSALDHADEIVDFYTQTLPLVRSTVRFYRTETMRAAKPLKKDTLGLIPFWLQQTKTKRDTYMLFLESGAAPDEPSDTAFAFDASPNNGYVRLILPVDFRTESADAFVKRCLSLAPVVQFDSGQAGLAVNWNDLGDYGMQAREVMNGLSARHPGLDMSFPFSTKYVVGTGIKGVDWLTFLAPRYVEMLGGVAALRAKLEPAIVYELPNGIGIQAGEYPEAGDVNRRRTVPQYRDVGRVLAAIRAKEHAPIFGPEGIQDGDVTESWLARFDR